MCFSAKSTRTDSAADWSPSSVFDETDSAMANEGPVAAVIMKDTEVFGMKHIDVGSEVFEVLMDRGEPRRAGIGLVGRIFNRKYRRSRVSKVEEDMANIAMHRWHSTIYIQGAAKKTYHDKNSDFLKTVL